MTDNDGTTPTLIQQHLAAAGLLLALGGDVDLCITIVNEVGLSVQVPAAHNDPIGLFRRVGNVVGADVVTTRTMLDGTRHLIAEGGVFDGVPVRVYTPLSAGASVELAAADQ